MKIPSIYTCIPHGMAKARVNQEEEVDKNNSERVVKNMKIRNMDTESKSSYQGIASAKDLSPMLPEERYASPHTPFYRSD